MAALVLGVLTCVSVGASIALIAAFLWCSPLVQAVVDQMLIGESVEEG